MPEHNSKQALLQATIDVVAEGGLNNFAMKKVTDRVGVSEALIYKYYQTKDHLLHCCFESIHGEIGRLCAELSVDIDESSPAQLYQLVRRFWMGYFDYLVEHGNATLFYFAYRDSSYVRDIMAHDRQVRRSYFSAFSDFVDRLDAQLHIFEKTSDAHLWTYVLDTTGIFAKRVIRGELPNTPESTENIWQLLFGGILGLIRPQQ